MAASKVFSQFRAAIRRRQTRRVVDRLSPQQRADIGLGSGSAVVDQLFDREAIARRIYLGSLR